MSALKKITTLLHSRSFNFILGILLIAIAIKDIYTELLDPSHEHILIIMGVLMVIKAINHFHDGINHMISKDRKEAFSRLFYFMHTRTAAILMGLVILITSIYGLCQDLDKMISKSTSILIGLHLLIVPVLSIFKGFKRIIVPKKS